MRSPQAREDPLPEGHAETPSRGGGPFDGVLEREAREVLQAAVDRIPGEQRAVFVLRAVEGLSYREIAAALDISLGTVMSRLSRARERLREALSPFLGGKARRAGRGE